MLFDIPFYNDKKYLSFVIKKQKCINSIYYRIPNISSAIDARNAILEDIPEFHQYKLIKEIPKNIKKYGLLNTKVFIPDFYKDNVVDEFNEILIRLFTHDILDGIIVTDFMFLQKIRQRFSDIFASKIEIIPSVNMKLDSVEQISLILSYIKRIGFKIPSKLILDRSLNRSPNKLKTIYNWKMEKYPSLKLVILVNEGCLPYCPFKDSHDIFISLFNQDQNSNKKEILKHYRENGCLSIFKNEWRYLTSPFIRPEDIKNIEEYVDVLKIAGRTHSFKFLERTFNAYYERKWDGNLFYLLDTSHPISDDICILNSDMPENFYKTTSSCDLDCGNCIYCKKLFAKLIRHFQK